MDVNKENEFAKNTLSTSADRRINSPLFSCCKNMNHSGVLIAFMALIGIGIFTYLSFTLHHYPLFDFAVSSTIKINAHRNSPTYFLSFVGK